MTGNKIIKICTYADLKLKLKYLEGQQMYPVLANLGNSHKIIKRVWCERPPLSLPVKASWKGHAVFPLLPSSLSGRDRKFQIPIRSPLVSWNPEQRALPIFKFYSDLGLSLAWFLQAPQGWGLLLSAALSNYQSYATSWHFVAETDLRDHFLEPAHYSCHPSAFMQLVCSV